MGHSQDDLSAQIRYGFRLALCRPPQQAESDRLAALHGELQTRYKANQKLAADMATSLAGALPDGMSATDLAVWTVISNVLLNLDEALTKR